MGYPGSWSLSADRDLMCGAGQDSKWWICFPGQFVIRSKDALLSSI